MKFLSDLFPVILFFGAYKIGGIYPATLAGILASILQVVWLRVTKGHFEKLSLITLGIISILGSATLYFRNDLFIKWKPTAVYWVISSILLISQLMKKPLIPRLMENAIVLPDKIWTRLNFSWSLFFALMGLLNLYVAYHFDTGIWVNFKLFGTLGLMLVFILLQGIIIVRYYKPLPPIQSRK